MFEARNENRCRNRRRNARSIRRAFTLLEIIVVVTIIALLATMVAPKLLQNIWKSKQKVAHAEAVAIAQQVRLYCVDQGWSKPPEDMDLHVLTQGSSPMLEEGDLLDPWGNPYMLRVPGQEHIEFDIMSYGGDGEAGGEGENKDVFN